MQPEEQVDCLASFGITVLAGLTKAKLQIRSTDA